ncbi:DUF4011 domain-containing protein [Agrococcus sediminis]|uniref:DUF4011 domain-containing protein n=1 Tax=Agrococcus sediminis TaxID=2599924 RepID=A0A5M8QIW3_9MICO|nr:DUF4011 domain-containing protein [Agrococcus sediminis]KAA6435959.1 DUF4011 domain-containing protein [Agrococcus sediminis]
MLEELLRAVDELVIERISSAMPEGGDAIAPEHWPILLHPDMAVLEAERFRRSSSLLSAAARICGVDARQIVPPLDRLLSALPLSTESARRAELDIQLLADSFEIVLDIGSEVPEGEAQPQSATVEVRVDGELTFARAISGWPLIDMVRVDAGGLDLRESALSIEIIAAGGSVSQPWRRAISLAPGESEQLLEVDVLLDPALALQVTTAQRATVRASVVDASGTDLVVGTANTVLHGPHQWARQRPTAISSAMLAAHVQPHAKGVQELLPAVDARLKERTGNGGFDLYQNDDPARVDATAYAAFEVIAGLGLTYADPPAAWGEFQLIRTPDEAVSSRFGTCMDTTVLVASLLEAIGINSMMILMPGHINLAYWRKDPTDVDAPFARQTVTSGPDAAATVESRLRRVETTALTGEGTAEQKVRRALTAPPAAESFEALEVSDVIDVRAARHAGVRPLPARVVAPDGSVQIIEFAGDLFSATNPAPVEFVGAHQRPRSAKPPRIESWKSALLDLSLRNKLLNYPVRQRVRLMVSPGHLHDLEDALNADAIVTIAASLPLDPATYARYERRRELGDREAAEAFIHEQRGAVFEARRTCELEFGDRVRRETASGIRIVERFARPEPERFAKTLRKMMNDAAQIERETGTHNLYLAFGLLHWENKKGQKLQAPLILVPVRIRPSNKAGSAFKVQIDQSGASTPNFALHEKLKVELGITVPALVDPPTDKSGIDLAATFAAVRETLARADKHFEIEEVASLGLFQFGTFRLWKDLDENWEHFQRSPLVKHMIENPSKPFEDPVPPPPEVDLDDLAAQSPLPPDASQLEAVAAAVHGSTFVLEGPPGTGKSQTITNLMAHAMTSGKRVLFVAEKAEALEVVAKRMRDSGLSDLMLNLHHDAATPASVRAQLLAALDTSPGFDAAGMDAQRSTIDSSQSRLQRYAKQVHEPNNAGLSLHTARDGALAGALAGHHALQLPPSVVERTGEDLAAVRASLRAAVAPLLDAAPRPGHPWSFIDRGPSRPAEIRDAAVALDRAVLDAQREAPALLAATAAEAMQVVVDAARGPVFDPNLVARWAEGAPDDYLAAVRTTLDAINADTGVWRQTHRGALAAVDERWFEEAEAADRGNPFTRGRRRREVLSRVADQQLQGDALAPGHLKATAESLRGSVHRLRAFREALRGLPLPGLQNANPFEDADRLLVESAVSWLRFQLELVRRARQGDAMAHAALEAGATSRLPVWGALASRLQETWRALESVLGEKPQLGSAPLQGWRDLRLASGAPIVSGDDSWTELVRALEPLRLLGFDDLRARLMHGEARDPEELESSWQQALHELSVAERQRATRLDDFDRAAHERAITRFVESTMQLRRMLPERIPTAVVEHRTFDSSTRSGRIGELRRVLAQQRRGATVREIMLQFSDLITQLTPCVLASPDGAARFLPPERDLFDIVVFDEASQIKVSHAIGALGRAKSAVIAGDTMQMPPSSGFGGAAVIDDAAAAEDEIPLLDEASILAEAVKSQVEQRWLARHYRSQDESLIAFSIEKYYPSKLTSFPAPQAESPLGLSFRRVDGEFVRTRGRQGYRTNPAEAAAIVEEVEQRHRAAADERAIPDIGVITLNMEQRKHIEALLQESQVPTVAAMMQDPDDMRLWVRNLESVQGMESDIVLFSIAFSKSNGAVPLNFGPTNQDGGHKRLNVAVTRAKQQTIVFCSFEPEELQAERSSSKGLQHLKEYLLRAKHGVTEDDERILRRRVQDRHRDEIAVALAGRGLIVHTDRGLSDFRIEITLAHRDAPERELVAVLLDGPAWLARRTVGDRDGLPISVLRSARGWPSVERVWLPEWLTARESVLDRLERALDAAHRGETIGATPDDEPAPPSATQARTHEAVFERPEGGTVRSASSARTTATSRSADLLARHTVVYRSVGIERHSWPEDFDRMSDHALGGFVAANTPTLLDTEGPMLRARLARVFAESFGFDRLTARIERRIVGLVPKEYIRTASPDFFWPLGVDPERYLTVRRNTETASRPLEHIPLEEIANAMALAAAAGGGGTPEALARDALEMFDLKRMTQKVQARLEGAYAVGIESGRLKERDGNVHAGKH